MNPNVTNLNDWDQSSRDYHGNIPGPDSPLQSQSQALSRANLQQVPYVPRSLGGDRDGRVGRPLLRPLQSFAEFAPCWGPYRSPHMFPEDWRVLKKLGNANFGEVFLYDHIPTRKVVVIKRISNDESAC